MEKTSELDEKRFQERLLVFPREDPSFLRRIIEEFKLHPIIAQVFVSRGFTSLESIHSYLYSQLPDLHDPFLLDGMGAAVRRLIAAVQKGEGILIYGDHDVDGMTGTALLVQFLRLIGTTPHYVLSARSISREGIFLDAIDDALKNGCKLMITVDCGISAAAEIEKVVERSIDVIITDHHEPTDRIPHCIATLNPKLLHSRYPNRELTGVGVAFKLAHATMVEMCALGLLKPDDVDLKRLLDLVALGTISDMGILQGENRILVRYGLMQLNHSPRVGLEELMEVCEIDSDEVSAFEVASKLAPRLNSLGRIDDPRKGVDLLLIKESQEAKERSKQLEENNQERQRIERHVFEQVESMLACDPELSAHKALFLEGEGWHQGVIAIISAKLMKMYNRPTIIVAIEGGLAKGSIRSIPEFPLLTVLKQASNLLVNFGGHDFAAGVTVTTHNLPAFRRHFLEAADHILDEGDIQPKIKIDARADFKELTLDFLESLQLLEPHGNGNPSPIFLTEATQAWPAKLIGKHHLRLYLEQDGRTLEGVAFGKGYLLPRLRNRSKILIAYTPELNDFRKKWAIQLRVVAVFLGGE